MNRPLTLPHSTKPASDRALLTVRVLFFVKMLLVIPFGVISSTLVLYTTHKLNLSDLSAINLIALFLGCTGILRITIGYIAGLHLSYRQLLLFSPLFMMIGCLLATFPSYLYIGISFVALGSASTIAVNCLLTTLFKNDNLKRETVFLRNYSGMNIGYLTAFFLSGYYTIYQDYQRLFMITSIICLLGWVIIVVNWQQLKLEHNNVPNQTFLKQLITLLGIMLMPFLLSKLMQNIVINKTYFFVINLILFMLISAFVMKKSNKPLQNKLGLFFIFVVPVLIFATLQNLTPTLLTLFIERQVDRHFFIFTIPPQWVGLVNITAIIIGGHLLSYLFKWLREKGVDINPALQFSVGLIAMGASLFIVVIGILLSRSLVSIHWVIVSSLLQGISELLIVPIGFSIIAKIASPDTQGLMMGCWLLLLSIGALLSGYLSKIITQLDSHLFLLGSLSVSVGMIIILFYKLELSSSV
ncbi:MFS transporter [Legionella sp. D16C41]|uniref:POT-type proton-dependent oligopeptide transporter n=1 Tax=Legionella sp. D16C41 TaxID=3402688 RepID=UPI003AF66051